MIDGADGTLVLFGGLQGDRDSFHRFEKLQPDPRG